MFAIGREPYVAMSIIAKPARPLPAVRLGVTGHRPGPRLPASHEVRVSNDIASILQRLAEAARALWHRDQSRLPDTDPELRLVSALAEGADRIAASLALGAGWSLDVVLPFTPRDYRADFETPASRHAFDDFLAHAACVHCLAMPPQTPRRPLAYEAAGRWMLDNCDILVAVWDGKPGLGRGGTVDIIEQALGRGMPVIHVHAAQAAAPVLLAKDRETGERKSDLSELLSSLKLPVDRRATEPLRQRR